jgi:hypothetical protein
MDLGRQPRASAAAGLDEQWLMSVAHTEADLARALEVFTSFLDAVADPAKIEPAYA